MFSRIISNKKFQGIAVVAALVCITAITAYRYLTPPSAVRTLAAPIPGKTLIIDAGHGGADGGAISVTGVKESEINLAIALKTEQIAAFLGISPVMTRTREDLSYSTASTTIRKMKAEDQKNRLTLINSYENAVMISIHQNKYPSSGPHGPQVLYAPTAGSAEWGVTAQKLLNDFVGNNSKRAAVLIADNILLMNHIKCPAILIECGFLSNAADESNLRSEKYQAKLASVIIAALNDIF